MNDDPVYVNVGDEFNTEDNSWRYPDDLENQELIQHVFAVCGGRSYFRSNKEARKWRKIDGQLSRGAISKEWVDNCVDWATRKNSRVCAIKVDALGSLILNKARMQDWQLDRRAETKKEIEDKYKDKD